MDMYCNNCKMKKPITSMCSCSQCGTMVCRDCAERSFYSCNCSGKYNGIS